MEIVLFSLHNIRNNIVILVKTGSARMDRVTLNAGCRRSDGGAIGRQSCERLAIYYSFCLFVSAAARAVFILRPSTSVLRVPDEGRPHS